MEPIKDSEFRRLRAKGKFKGIDFLETLFTGYQMYLYLYGKRDLLFARRKFPIYFGKDLREKLIKNINLGKIYG